MVLILVAALAAIVLVIAVSRMVDAETPAAEPTEALPTVQPPRPAQAGETTQQQRRPRRQAAGAGAVRRPAAVPDGAMDDDPEAPEVRLAYGAADMGEEADGAEEAAGVDGTTDAGGAAGEPGGTVEAAEAAAEVGTMEYLGEYQVFGYDLCPTCCGKTDGIAASGTAATVGRTAACNSLPFGTRVYIEGIGERVIEDTGALASNVIDVLCADHAGCFAVTGKYAVYRIADPETAA